MRTTAAKWLILSVLLQSGCTSHIDIAAEQRKLIQADRDFARETTERGADGWADFFATDAIMFPSAGRVDGRDAIRERMGPVFAEGQPRLVWEPSAAVVGSGGDLGYTTGRWKTILPTEQGDSTLAEGHYVTIWKKVPGEGWRVAVDIGNSDAE